MPSDLLFLLIPAVTILMFVLAAIFIRRAQTSFRRVAGETGAAGPGLYQAAGESREAFVRRNWQRSGVVANGETLVDLYDRIAKLEQRLAAAEARLAQGPQA
jgi:hypothetical protein